jgi:hypothetical protein
MAITREEIVEALLRRVPFPERGEESVEVMMLTGGARLAARGGREESTASGLRDAGPWAASGAGPKGFPGVLLYFYFSFLFFQFCFL